MLAIILAPFYILINIYVIRWLILWMSSCNKCFKNKWLRILLIILYSFFALSILIGFLLPLSNLKRFMVLIGNYWLGTFFYIISTIVIADLIRIIFLKFSFFDKQFLQSRKLFVFNGVVCITIITLLSLFGFFHVYDIKKTYYDIEIKKDVKVDELKIALVADLHLGYNVGFRQIEKMVDLINSENPDLVIFAGDIFDNSFDALREPEKICEKLNEIKSKYGIYAVYGNHDVSEKILAGFTFTGKNDYVHSDSRMDKLLNDAGIVLLQDEFELIDDSFYLYGRLDYHKLGKEVLKRKSPDELTFNMDKDKVIIVIDHEPKELDELSDSGVDLDLSGHTHDGQIFPANIFMKLIFKNSYGIKYINNMTSVVTSGVGVYGPNMRIGTTAEVAILNVSFNSK